MVVSRMAVRNQRVTDGHARAPFLQCHAPPFRRALRGLARLPRPRLRLVQTRPALDRQPKSWSDDNVPADDSLGALVPRLLSATYFDDAASAVLLAMLSSAEVALRQGSYGRLLRAVIHLRPGGSYERLFGLEFPAQTKVEGLRYVSSGNVLKWIEQHRCSVSIDLHRNAMRSWLQDGVLELQENTDGTGLPGEATRERLLHRDATHVHIVPLRTPGGAVDGVITLEASCRSGASDPAWELCHEELEVLGSVAAAFLAAKPLPSRAPEPPPADDLLPVVGGSMASLIDLLQAFAPRDDTLMICGPTGAGKSRLARWCHARSGRKELAFEHLDLLGVPEDLQMAELFGWKRGAFTGAVRDNQGALGRAGRGTLFLDEIDKLSLKAQAGLLRFIEDRRYRMLGDDSAQDRRSEARLIVGTNADLRAAVRSGKFREDLYYRINVLPVRLLPLSERLDELPLWASYMLKRRHREAGGEGEISFDSDAVRLLSSMPWPGNLRQLDNIVRRAYALWLGAQSAPSSDLTVRARYVERALTFESDAEPNAVIGLLWRAARAFVVEADRRSGGPEPLSIDAAEAFRGVVLAAALQHVGNRDEAFALLGQKVLVKNRNHHRALRRELLKVRDLLQKLGGSIDQELETILASDVEVPSEDPSSN